MTQHDMNIANADGATFRADLNVALQALVENSSGATEPSTTFSYQWWADTSTDLMKIRNAANSAWITVFTLSTGGVSLVTTPDLPRLYLSGLGTSIDTDTDHDIAVAVGECRDVDDTENMVLSSIITKRLDATWAVGDDAGGLDTGSVANDTWYHVFLIKRSDTGVVDVLFSASATSPTMPTNYDKKRWIRADMLTDGSANIIGYTQLKKEFLWNTVVSDFVTVNPGTSAITQTLTVPTGRPVISKISFQHEDTSPAGGSNGIVTSLDQADTSPSTNFKHTRTSVESEIASVEVFVRTNTSAQIRYRISASDAGITVRGNTFGWLIIDDA